MDWNTQRRQNQGNDRGSAFNPGPLAMAAEPAAAENPAAAGKVAQVTQAPSHRQQRSSSNRVRDPIPTATETSPLPAPTHPQWQSLQT